MHKTLTAIIRRRQHCYSGDGRVEACRSEMHRLLGWCRDRRRCGRRRVGVAVLRLWLSRVQLRLPSIRLRATVRILWRLLRTASLLYAPLLPLLSIANRAKSPGRVGSAVAWRIGDAIHVGSDATDDGRVVADRYGTIGAANFPTPPPPPVQIAHTASVP